MVKNIYCTIKYTCCSLMMSMAVTVGVAQEKIADRLKTWNIGFMTEIFVVLSREKVGIMWFSTPKEEER